MARIVVLVNPVAYTSGVKAATKYQTAKGTTAPFCVLSVGCLATGTAGGVGLRLVHPESSALRLAGHNLIKQGLEMELGS